MSLNVQHLEMPPDCDGSLMADAIDIARNQSTVLAASGDICGDKKFTDYGVDSLTVISILVELAGSKGVPLEALSAVNPPPKLINLKSLVDLVEQLEGAKRG